MKSNQYSACKAFICHHSIGYFVGLFFLLLVSACHEVDDKIHVVPKVDHAAGVELMSWEYIKLETPEGERIPYVEQLEIYDDMLVIMDSHRASKIFVFDLEGKFLFSIKAEPTGAQNLST